MFGMQLYNIHFTGYICLIRLKVTHVIKQACDDHRVNALVAIHHLMMACVDVVCCCRSCYNLLFRVWCIWLHFVKLSLFVGWSW